MVRYEVNNLVTLCWRDGKGHCCARCGPLVFKTGMSPLLALTHRNKFKHTATHQLSTHQLHRLHKNNKGIGRHTGIGRLHSQIASIWFSEPFTALSNYLQFTHLLDMIISVSVNPSFVYTLLLITFNVERQLWNGLYSFFRRK